MYRLEVLALVEWQVISDRPARPPPLSVALSSRLRSERWRSVCCGLLKRSERCGLVKFFFFLDFLGIGVNGCLGRPLVSGVTLHVERVLMIYEIVRTIVLGVFFVPFNFLDVLGDVVEARH
jgi:hypothetical protein